MSDNAPEHPVTDRELKRQFKWQDFAIVIAILGGFGSGYLHLINEARAQADAGVSTVKVRLDAIEDDQRQVRKDVREKVAEVQAELQDLKVQQKEAQADIRALYRYLQTGKPQPRLENGDGGTP